MSYQIQVRRDTEANWNSNNPVLAAGEIAFSTDQNKIKIGDGTTAWASLSYMTGSGGGAVATDTIWDAKGDLAAGTGSNTAQKLTVGSNDTALIADSAQTTGLKWAAIVNSVTGTANEVTVSGSTGAVTIGLPDAITVVDLNTDQVDFNTTPASTTMAQARVLWDATDTTLQLGMNANVVCKIGQGLYKNCRNNSGGTINKGEVVYISGSHASTSLTIAKARADTEATSADTIGIAAENISNNTTGFVQVFGLLTGITTNAITGAPSEGDPLYLSESTAGELRAGIPTAPNHGVRVGFLVKSAGSGAGSIFVNVQNYQELEELSDVLISSRANNDMLVWDSTDSRWENRTTAQVLSNIGAAASSHTHAATDITSGTLDISRIPTGSTSSTVCIGDDARLSDPRTPLSHTHGNITNGGLIGTTAGLVVKTGTSPSNGAVTTLAMGTAGQVLAVNSGATDIEWVNNTASASVPDFIFYRLGIT